MHEMSATVYLLTIGLIPATALVIFAMKYGAAAYQARARAAGDENYRSLVEQAAASQFESAASLSGIKADLAEIKTRLSAVEKILKAVE